MGDNSRTTFSIMVTKKKQQKTFFKRGVTLIEMIVVIGIFGLVSSVLMFNYSDFSNNVSIRNLSQDIALNLRKAQTYATSVQSLPNGASTTDFPSYGISFSPNTTVGTTTAYAKQVVFFADIPTGSPLASNKKYDYGAGCGTPDVGNECIQRMTIATQDKVLEVCRDVNSVEQCATAGVLDVTFRRPSPDAIICFRPVGYGSDCALENSSYAKVVLESPKGIRRTVLVWNTGQIAVQ